MRCSTFALALAPLLASCSGNTAPAAPRAAATPTSAAAPTPAPTPTHAPTPTPTPAPAPAPAPDGDRPSSFFPAIIHAQSYIAYHPLKRGAVLIDGTYLGTPILIDDAGARVEPALFKGLSGVGAENAFMVFAISGDWPRSGSLSLNLPGDRGGTDINYTWNGSTWVKAAANAQPFAEMPERIVAAYYDGGLIGQSVWGGRTLYYSFGVTGGDYAGFALDKKGPKIPLPVITKGSGDCSTKLVGYAELASLASGELVGVGKLCTSKDDQQYLTQTGAGALAVERWPKGSARSVIEVLPGTAGKGSIQLHGAGFLEVGGGSLFVFTTFLTEGAPPKPYLGYYNGKGWVDISPPASKTIQTAWLDKRMSLWLDADGELWRRAGGAWENHSPPEAKGSREWLTRGPDDAIWARYSEVTFRRTADGAWERVILPRDSAGERYIADGVRWRDGETLILAHGQDGGALLSDKRPEKVLDRALPDPTAPAPTKSPSRAIALGALGRVTPPTSSCKNLFVVLYKLSRVAPPDFDFPLTRAALKGHTELADVRFAETEDFGARYLVAFVPTLARGKALVKLVQEKVATSKPQMLCGEPPKTNRDIKINLTTGELIKEK